MLQRWLPSTALAQAPATPKTGAAVAGADQPTSTPIIDRAAIAKLRELLGDADFNELVPTFLQDVNGMLATLPAAAARGDAKEAERVAHGLKSGAANLGMRRASTLAKALETAAKAGDLEDADARIDAIVEAFQDAHEILQQTVVSEGEDEPPRNWSLPPECSAAEMRPSLTLAEMLISVGLEIPSPPAPCVGAADLIPTARRYKADTPGRAAVRG